MSASYAQLKDFDWSLRMVLSSDTLSTQRQPVLMLQLRTVQADGSTAVNTIELAPDEVDNLVAQLERAGGALQQIQTT